jgi:hypothetical protein
MTDMRRRQRLVLDRAATQPPVSGHTVTQTDADHPNMVNLVCECGYLATAVRAFAHLLVAEHTRTPDAHTNPRNCVR